MAAFDEVDLELIGALMDGRLTGAERERAIKLLGESEAAFEVYADALRARADLEAKVVPIEPRLDEHQPRRRRWLVAVPAAAAAALLIAVLPSVQARRGDEAVFAASTTAIALPLTQREDLRSTLRPGWEERSWSVMRGGVRAGVDSTTDFRLGVRAMDLRVALAAGDAERARSLTGEVLDLLQAMPVADAPKAEYEGLRSRIERRETGEQLMAAASNAEETLENFLDSRWFGYGKWLAAGELAARTGSASFFTSPSTSRFFRATIQRGTLAPDDAELLRQVQTLAGQGVSGGEFDTIQQKLAELIRRFGG
jgi:hypothetical protein